MPMYADLCPNMPRGLDQDPICYELKSLNSLKGFNKMLKRHRRSHGHWPQHHHKPFLPFNFEHQENPGNSLLNVAQSEILMSQLNTPGLGS